MSERPWSGVTAADYPSADAYCAACLIDLNAPGATKAKDRCKLPVYEPASRGGELNRHAVHAAAARLVRRARGVDAPPAARVAAARSLLRLYAALQEHPPRSLAALAAAAPHDMQQRAQEL